MANKENQKLDKKELDEINGGGGKKIGYTAYYCYSCTHKWADASSNITECPECHSTNIHKSND